MRDDTPGNGPGSCEGDPADELAPPPRRRGVRSNPIMLGVLVLVVVVFCVFVLMIGLG